MSTGKQPRPKQFRCIHQASWILLTHLIQCFTQALSFIQFNFTDHLVPTETTWFHTFDPTSPLLVGSFVHFIAAISWLSFRLRLGSGISELPGVQNVWSIYFAWRCCSFLKHGVILFLSHPIWSRLISELPELDTEGEGAQMFTSPCLCSSMLLNKTFIKKNFGFFCPKKHRSFLCTMF